MKILFTGASSFTGCWFVQSLAAAGHEVVCPLAGGTGRYTGVRQERVKLIESICRLVPDAPFGSENFLKLAAGGQFALLCHHGAEVANYKSPDFDAVRAVHNNALNLRAVLAAVKPAAVLLTGSVFENDEGAGNEPLRAFSAYGLSKGLTWQMFRFYCDEARLPLGKFVIPNPFGPLEEPRFTAYLMRTWREGKTAGVKTPDYLRDNIHADLLAAAYVNFAGRVAGLKSGLLKLNPSGYVEKQGEFARRVSREVSRRLGWECKLELSRQEDFSEPLERINTDAMPPLFPAWSETKAWDSFVEFYRPKAGQ